MADEKDRLGETLRLLERAKEDIYFAQRDRELIEKLKAQLQKVEKENNELRCPRSHGVLETHTFQGFVLDRCQKCGGIWLDNGELEAIIKQFNRVSLGAWIHKLLAKEERTGETEQQAESESAENRHKQI
jgi:Zn-finger nucleic acid-binding protein